MRCMCGTRWNTQSTKRNKETIMVKNQQNQPEVKGLTAEFDSVDSLLAACRRIRDAGYTKTDAFTPFPVHGIDTALGIRPTVLPWIALGGGVIGCLTALAMQIWMNGIDYQYIISGKPMISLPAFIPVAFELTILLASFGAFFGMLALNKLPRFSNPLFTNPRFDRSTDDRFFLFIDSADQRFQLDGARKLLGECGSEYVQEVVEDNTSAEVPRILFYALVAIAIVALVPPIIIARMRVTRSTAPRYHVFYDMDFSPAKDAQTTTTLFADGRSMRPDVPGTVARGQLDFGLDFNTGIDMEKLAAIDPRRAEQLVSMSQPPAEEPPAEEPPAEEPPAEEPPAEEPPAEEPPAEEPSKSEDAAAEMKESPAEEKKETPPAEESSEKAEVEAIPVAESEMKEDSAAAGDEAAPAEAGQGEAAAMADVAVDDTPWLQENPLPLTIANLQRGQLQFNIYCAVCHGRDGSGTGLVARRAQKILSPTWVPPTRIYNVDLGPEQYPDGKLFNTITHGIRKMPGYGAQIGAKDRWAIVAYIRALQASRNADMLGKDLIPSERLEEIEQLKEAVKQRLEAEAKQAAEAASQAAQTEVTTQSQNS